MGGMAADLPQARPIRGVCVITVERQLSTPDLITVLVVPDVARPQETSRRYVVDARQALSDVQAFLLAMIDRPG
jgi:CTP:molybdopterin cytidylyltransferase MocA